MKMTAEQEDHFFEVLCKVFGVEEGLTADERAELLNALPED